MRTSLFVALDVYQDEDWSHSAAMNMAIDEALFESAKIPSIRFYRWSFPALSFGYFGQFGEVARYAYERDLVRRWTGGGIVFHGLDRTYSIVIPASDPVFGESSRSIYEKIHYVLADALADIGQPAVVAAIDDRGGAACSTETGINDPEYKGARGCCSCFSNPVRADVMLNGRKIAGAAQRRTRAGLLHQGSIQGVDLGNGLADRFAKRLASSCNLRNLSAAVQDRAQEIAAQKYGTESWLRRR